MNSISPINSYSEKYSTISYTSYTIETSLLNSESQESVTNKMNAYINKKKFPPNLQYVDSFLDKKTGMSGVAFKDNNTNKVTIGFAGTNVGSGNTSDMIKDVGADLNIGLSLVDAHDPYFNETNKFINKIKKKHEIEAFTGHSKGGRDAMVLGIEHNIDDIVIFNSASLDLKGRSQIHATINDWMVKPLSNPLELSKKNYMDYLLLHAKAQNYKGNIIHFRNNNDLVSVGLSLMGGSYYGKDFVFKGGGHGLSSMMSYERQLEIKKILNKRPYATLVKETHQRVQRDVKKRLSSVDNLRANLVSANGGSLSSNQEKLLETQTALTLIQGLNQLLDAEIDLMLKEYDNAIGDLNILWSDTIVQADDLSQGKLSEGEILSALSDGNATEQSIVIDNEETINTKKDKLKEVGKKYDELINKIQEAIDEILQNDQVLAQQIRMFST
ncbi:hypothetical protein BUZ57_11425 [Staphylococcus hyicus]|uniref:Cytosolic protein n=1 Tax=Staphylococcus hyicus TaxID=1284 RepID=A0A418JGD6_STAHY|nr:hypothetical protein [Staphylococcus hyicus]NJH80584.1 hypothetical protein [Staphylococcus hyicus]RIO43041.1 hypothetical protein BUZ57_11425 [Staphylococcus hyicus]